jgi:uncharacterized BrkB/YihY/UPF0761 family membrane protein
VNRWLGPALAAGREGSRRVVDDRLSVHAGSLTYGAFLSLPPLLLLALSVMGFSLSGRPQAQVRVAEGIVTSIPGLESVAGAWIDSVVDGRTVLGLLAVPTVLYTGLGVVARARVALGDVFGAPVSGLLRARAQGLTRLVPLGVAFLVLVSAVGLVSSLSYGGRLPLLSEVLVLSGLSVLAVGWAGLTFRLLSPDGSIGIREHWPGALAYGISFVLIQRVGALLVPLIGSGDVALYGALSATFVLLGYIYALAFTFLLAAELTVWNRDGRPLPRL